MLSAPADGARAANPEAPVELMKGPTMSIAAGSLREGTGLPRSRYSAVAMALHWAIAVLIAVQIAFGWYMGDLSDHAPAKRSVEAIHISLGLTILLLTAGRLAWAMTHRGPPLPLTMARWERRLAWSVHVLFYVMLFALPLSGWIMESIGTRPIPFWGLAWPHFPGLSMLLQGLNSRTVKSTLEEVHGSPMVWTMIVLVGLHTVGALKHQFDGSPVLWRMFPLLKRPG